MKKLSLIDILKNYFTEPLTAGEVEFQKSIYQATIPGLIVTLFFITTVILPLRFGYNANLLSHPNFYLALGVLATTTLCFGVSKLTKGTRFENLHLSLLPTIVFLIGTGMIFVPSMMESTPFVPFNVQLLAIFISGVALSSKGLLAFLGVNALSLIFVSFMADIPTPELFHRTAIVFIFWGFNVVSSAFRHYIYQRIEDESTRLLTSSNVQVLAELSGSFAHEINNPLAIISGYAQAMKDTLNLPNPSPKDLSAKADRVIDATQRISKIVQSLNKFSQAPAQMTFQEVIPCQIVEDAETILQEALRQSGTQVVVTQHNPSLRVSVFPMQLTQVFVNLFSNSIEAMRQSEKRVILIDINRRGEQIQFIMQDTGPGISEEQLKNVGKPFFSSRKGPVGLGIPICQRIVLNHGGNMEIKNINGRTQFIIEIPTRTAESNLAA